MQGRMRPENSHTFAFDDYLMAMDSVLKRESIGRVAVVFGEEASRLGF
jgi:hypothetical protein